MGCVVRCFRPLQKTTTSGREAGALEGVSHRLAWHSVLSGAEALKSATPPPFPSFVCNVKAQVK